MTQEEKSLLLRDLCARLPYGVIVQPAGSASAHRLIGYDKDLIRVDIDVRYDLENVKPYLRKWESMTIEERAYMNTFNSLPYDERILANYDYLNAIHVDYRGLIPKCLALEAPDGMYK